MSDTTLPVRLAQTLGLTSSTVLAGFTISTSFTLVPRLLESPTPLLLKQWGKTFNAGQKNAPPFAALSAACYFYLSYTSSAQSKIYSYLAAGLLTVGIVPYTLLVMKPTNDKLLRKVEETKALGIKDKVVEVGLGEETAHKLVDNWGLMNLGRAGMLLLGSLVGTWTALN